MIPFRHRARLTALALASLATGSGLASVCSVCLVDTKALAAEPDPPPSTGESSVSGSSDPGEPDVASAVTLPLPAPAPAPEVVLSGGANGSLAPIGEAWTTWRYGRSKASVSIDQTTTRLRVSGSGRTFEGLVVGFSIGLLAPTLHLGPYAAKMSVAAVWARHERVDVTPDIEWDSSAAGVRPSSMALSVTSMTEMSHTSERQGGVTVDVTQYRIHGRVDATLPCTRSAATLRQSCRPEAIRGEF